MQTELNCDVAIIGGGPAGVAAALCAARTGADTVLVERYGFLGGMSTAALVYPWMTFHTAVGEQVIRGVAQEIVDRLAAVGASPGHLRDTVGFTFTLTPFDPEVYKLLAFDMLREAGVRLIMHTSLAEAEAGGGRIRRVRLLSRGRMYRLAASVFVDATGDAELSDMAGAKCEYGNEEGKVQPMTMKFRMRGVNGEAIKDYMKRHPEDFYERTPFAELDKLPLTGVSGFYRKWKEAGAELGIPRDGVLFFMGPREDEALINTSRVSGLDPTDPDDLTTAEMEGRRQIFKLAEFFRRHIPGFERAEIAQTGVQIGVRETRRVVGDYVLNGRDVLDARRFDDVIARSGYPIDIHNPTGTGLTARFIREGGAYDIPYRSLVAQSLENLLLAGRCISTTHEAQATTRLTPSCMATGQAAGTAAALAAAHAKGAVRQVPIRMLQARLLKDGAELGLMRG